MLNHNKTYTVYRHVSPNGKQYVGITCKNHKDRWNGGRGYISNHHFWSAIIQYGWNNFQHEVLASGLSCDEAIEMEKRLIAEYNLTDPQYGYNITAGGEQGCGALSKEVRARAAVKRSQSWQDYNVTKRRYLTFNRDRGKVYRSYLDQSTIEEDWLDYDPLNPYCGENICKNIYLRKAERYFRKHYKNGKDIKEIELPLVTYGLESDLENLLYHIDEYDEGLFDTEHNVVVSISKEGPIMRHYDYVLCPDGKKHKVFDREDIEQLL
jgi:hypothetical protein